MDKVETDSGGQLYSAVSKRHAPRGLDSDSGSDQSFGTHGHQAMETKQRKEVHARERTRRQLLNITPEKTERERERREKETVNPRNIDSEKTIGKTKQRSELRRKDEPSNAESDISTGKQNKKLFSESEQPVMEDAKASSPELSGTFNTISSNDDSVSTFQQGSNYLPRPRSNRTSSSGDASRKQRMKAGSNTRSKAVAWRAPSLTSEGAVSNTEKKVEVGSSALMIGETVSAVRHMRAEAAILAFRLAEVHAQDAQELRQAASVMKGHVDSLNDEVKVMQSGLDDMEKSRWCWRTAMREIALFGAVMGVALGAEEAIRWFRSFGSSSSGKQQNSNSTPRLRGGVMGLAAVLMVGARYKSPEWKHMIDAIQGNEHQRQSLFEKWGAIIRRVAVMTALSQTEPTSSARVMESEPLPISNGATTFALNAA